LVSHGELHFDRRISAAHLGQAITDTVEGSLGGISLTGSSSSREQGLDLPQLLAQLGLVGHHRVIISFLSAIL
jgi:hypothetical protein